MGPIITTLGKFDDVDGVNQLHRLLERVVGPTPVIAIGADVDPDFRGLAPSSKYANVQS